MPDPKQKVRGDDPRFTAPALRNDCRPLVVRLRNSNPAAHTWQWKHGRSITIVYDPSGKRYEIQTHDILGMTANDYSRDIDDIPITPADVIDYIKFTILGLKEKK